MAAGIPDSLRRLRFQRPSSFHYFHVASAQAAFPDAETYICPGIERKRPDLDFDWFLADRPPAAWAGILEWDFDKIILSHGDLIEVNAKQRALEARKRPLNMPE